MNLLIPLYFLFTTYCQAFDLFDRASYSANFLRTAYNNSIESPYQLVDSEFLNEYNAKTKTYIHKKTGAEIFFINWNNSSSSASEEFDLESTFGIFFRTPPSDSTGVPHVLEHSLLTGSRKYKTKEPFVNLLKSSMQTFLNAMTWNDRTGYVFASRNTKDFYNIMNVYLDAVFFPRATSDPNVLAQEGWHLEPETFDYDNTTNTTDINLVYNGIVYSEMRGVYSNPMSLLYRHTESNLFPDNTYFFDSGGTPENIPDLTFEKFVNFYERFYHPTNAKIFVSDAEDIDAVLEIIHEYIGEFDENKGKRENSVVKFQEKNFEEPLYKTYPYPVADSDDDLEKKHIVTVSWLLNDEALSPLDELALLVLDYLLVMTPSSKLQKNLLESKLGDSMVGWGISQSLIQYYFSIGLSGVNEEDISNVEDLILETIEEAAENGFTDEEIESTMNSIEFQLREKGQSSDPKGISFMFSTMAKWNYDEKPTTGLKFESQLNELKEIIEESGSEIFQNLLKGLFVKNNHRVTLHLFPSQTLESEQMQKEKERIQQLKSQSSEEQILNIIGAAENLKNVQSTPDSEEEIATIPTVSIEDINPKSIEFPIEVENNAYGSGITMLSHAIESTSSGVVYIDMGLDISRVPFVDIPYLVLFNEMLGQTGTEELSDDELTQLIGKNTGGISTSLLVTSVNSENEQDEVMVRSDEHFVTKLFIKGKSLQEKTSDLLEIYKMVLEETKLDSSDKAQEILRQYCSNLKFNIPSSGHQYAYRRVGARYSISGFFNEELNGVSSLRSCNKLLKEVEEDWENVLAKLVSVKNTIFDETLVRSGMVINLTGNRNTLKGVSEDIEDFLSNFTGAASALSKKDELPDFYAEEHPWVADAREEMDKFNGTNEALVVSTQVNYVAQSRQLYGKGDIVPGSTAVITGYLRLNYLWTQIRVLLGAYGAFNVLAPDEGLHTFVSYRDPNIMKTIDVYDGAADNLKEVVNELRSNPTSLNLSIISTIGSLDGSVLSPQDKGWTSLLHWLTRESAEARQKWRTDILSTTSEDFENFAALLSEASNSIVFVCSQAAYEEVKDEIDDLALVQIS